MDPTLVMHIVAGSLALLSGYVALYATKGAPLHRRAGMVFFVTMLAMTALGGISALTRQAAPAVNIPAAVATAYLVITGLTTLRPPSPAARRITIAGMVAAFAVAAVTVRFTIEAISAGGSRRGIPAFAFVMFALIGFFGGIGDLRMLREGGVTGVRRVTRHLWRMTMALFVAAMSFFLGQADEIPRAIRNPLLLAIPVVAVLVTMIYWLWRVRWRRALSGIQVRAVEVAP